MDPTPGHVDLRQPLTARILLIGSIAVGSVVLVGLLVAADTAAIIIFSPMLAAVAVYNFLTLRSSVTSSSSSELTVQNRTKSTSSRETRSG